jgi:hypothetical protein
MCYSAEASFAASGVLAASSVAIARLPKDKASIPLSLFPGIFAAHQFTEGLIWLQQDGILSDTYKPGAVYAYALIAFVLWPVCAPFSAYLLETARRRRIIILICQALGLWVGFTLLLGIIRTPVQVSAGCCSLSYYVNVPDIWLIPYLIAVTLPFLISSQRILVLFGLAMVVSCAAAFFTTSVYTLPSVWCFFAALLSAGLYAHFRIADRLSAPQPPSKSSLNAFPN